MNADLAEELPVYTLQSSMRFRKGEGRVWNNNDIESVAENSQWGGDSVVERARSNIDVVFGIGRHSSDLTIESQQETSIRSKKVGNGKKRSCEEWVNMTKKMTASKASEVSHTRVGDFNRNQLLTICRNLV